MEMRKKQVFRLVCYCEATFAFSALALLQDFFPTRKNTQSSLASNNFLQVSRSKFLGSIYTTLSDVVFESWEAAMLLYSSHSEFGF